MLREPPLYCRVCTVPYEYCQWSGTLEECKRSLKEASVDLFTLLYPELIIEGIVIDSEVKEIKDENKPVTREKKKSGGQVIIKKVSRSKRKCSILILGLDAYGSIYEIDRSYF